jgi:hypothetical protein
MSIDGLKEGLSNRIAAMHLRRKFFWLLAIILLGFAIYAAIILYYPYSEGTRSGILRKLSHKGMVFKTWEGELQMSAVMVPNPSDDNIAGGNIWLFSVKDDATIKALQDAEVSGKRVNMHYKEHLKMLFWRGDTRYFVDGVSVVQD